MPLDLLVPDLLLPPDAPAAMRELRLPALEKWLVRADIERAPPGDAAAWLASRFAIPRPVPVAAISLAGERDPSSGGWLRADPVHLRVDRDGVILHDASILGVKRDEADALAAALQAHFRADDLEFHAPAPDRWYVRVPEGELPATTPLAAARGRDVFGMLPHGSGRINWRSAITEAQMILGSHEVNVKRERAGLPIINSIWFWGEGKLPPRVESPYSEMHVEDAFARGLARLSQAAVRKPPSALTDVDLVRAQDSVLVVLDALTSPLHRVETPAWRNAAQALDERWFRELGDAIARFDRVRIILPSENATRVANLTAAARHRWFRRRKPLAAHA
jgi:hypothetical protein